jgi:hypothetical protein
MRTALKVLFIVGQVIAIFIWFIMVFYALFLGGSPGPGYDRSVPVSYAGIIALGLLGAIIAVAGHAAGKKTLLAAAAILGVIGCVPLFMLDLPAVGLPFFLLGIAPLLGLTICKKQGQQNS